MGLIPRPVLSLSLVFILLCLSFVASVQQAQAHPQADLSLGSAQRCQMFLMGDSGTWLLRASESAG